MLIQRLFRIFVYLLCFTLPLNQFLNVRILIVSLVISLFVKESPLPSMRNMLGGGLYILVLLIGLVYSSDFMSGLRVLETSFSFLALPIILSRIEPMTSTEINKYFKIFSYGLSLACLICLLHACYKFAGNGDFHSFFFYNLTDIIGYDPTYFTYYIIFAITYCIYVLYYEESDFSIVEGALFTAFLFFMLLLTGGKTSFVCLLLVFSFFILKFLTEKRSSRTTNTIILIVVMLVSLFFVNYTEGNSKDRNQNSSWERMILWESAVKAVPNVIFGVGTGDYKSELDSYYRRNHLTEFAKESLNSHNQVLQLLFSNGMIGVFAFIILVSQPLYLAVRSQNMMAILIFFPFVIYGISEVFLGRYQGVIFFAWLHQLLILWTQRLQPIVKT